MQSTRSRANTTVWIRRTGGLIAACAALLVAGCGGSGGSDQSAARFAITLLPPSVHARPTTQAGPTHRPNIVFVLTDDLSMDLLRFMPHVQAMERHGLTFRNYFVSDSLCCPSRSSIFTGEFPHDTHVFTNFGQDGGFQAFYAHGDQRRTFALA